MGILDESKELDVYKRLVRVLGDYSDAFPATGVDKLFKKALVNGVKIIPKDAKALCILKSLLVSTKSAPAAVQELLNVRFSDLPMQVRPLFVNKTNGKEVAFWSTDRISDKAISLIDFENNQPEGKWVDVNGDAVSLVELVDEK